eukprot:SAG22_NODE_553_length_9168_cov_5.758628_5_plen_162_part_00
MTFAVSHDCSGKSLFFQVRLAGKAITLTDTVTARVDAEVRWTMHVCTAFCGTQTGARPWLSPGVVNRTISISGPAATIRSAGGASITLQYTAATAGSGGFASGSAAAAAATVAAWSVESARPPSNPAGQKQNEDYHKLVLTSRARAGQRLDLSVLATGSCH